MKSISWYKSLSESKGRRVAGCFLVEGARGVDQLLAYNRDRVIELLCVDGYDISGIDTAAIAVRTISAANMKTIASSRTPQGIAAVVQTPPHVYTSNVPDVYGNVLLLEDVQDPGNVGTLIRTAAAFGYCGIVMSGKCADPFSPKAIQSTAGSLLSLWIRKCDDYLDMADDLKSRGYRLIAADLDGSDRYNATDARRHVLILGNEGAGLSGRTLEKCDVKIRIPIVPSGAESLNVAVSGGIMMFMLRKG